MINLNSFEISLATIVLFLITSCSIDHSKGENTDNIRSLSPQEWELVSYQGQIANEPIKIPYREFILLNNDQTFIKTRIENGDTLQAEGEFKEGAFEINEDYIELSYYENNPLIENCSANKREYLMIREANLTGTANACDYPTKMYSLSK